jgi:hypothetical protein
LYNQNKPTMISVESPTQITIFCTFRNSNEAEFFDFDVLRKGDVIASENLFNALSYKSDVLSVKYFIGSDLIKGYSRVTQLN